MPFVAGKALSDTGMARSDLEVIMNRIRRPLAVLAGTIAIALLSGCTPLQLDTYESLSGHQLTESDRDALLPLNDGPMLVGTKLVMADGSVVDDPQAIVNGTRYDWGVPEPAMQAFRLVAASRGWTPAQISSWEIAIKDIMKGESGFCPNLLGGARLANTVGCVVSRQGSNSDAGFGQLIGIHHTITRAGTGWLCKEEGICGRWGVISSPWNSMTSLVAMIERSGVAPWCYNSGARRLHSRTCNNPGLDV